MSSLEPPANLKNPHRERLDAVIELKRQNDSCRNEIINIEETLTKEIHRLSQKIDQLNDNFSVVDARISKFNTDLSNTKDEIFDTIESYVSTETPRDSNNNILTLVNEVVKRIESLEHNINMKDREKDKDLAGKKLFRVKSSS